MLIDISMQIRKGMPVYPGNAKPELDFVKKIPKKSSNMSNIFMGSHTGTHLDAPLHIKKGGKSVDEINIANCFGKARVIDLTKLKFGDSIHRDDLKKEAIHAGEIILLKTKNSSSAKFRKDFVYLSDGGARYLLSKKVRAIGVDGLSVQKFRQGYCAAHCTLLTKGILVYEGLNLRNANKGKYIFMGFPLKIKGAEASPVRAVLLK